MEPSKLIVILLFCSVLRSYFVIALNPYFDCYYLGLAGQTLWNFSLFGFCCYQFRLKTPELKAVFGPLNSGAVGMGASIGILLLMFTFGEIAATTLANAHRDLTSAYSLGRFHEDVYGSFPFFSLHVFAYLVAGVFFPAYFEEFFFRGLLFPAFANKYRKVTGAAICSVIFALLHLDNGVQVNDFLFAFVLCVVYARGGSLYAAIAAHAVFNLLAFISSYYFDVVRTRPIEKIGSMSDWLPELMMLAISVTMLLTLAYIHRTFLWSWFEKPGVSTRPPLPEE
jgi:membrane protease YdiL (CAAX protease family)